MLYKFKSKTTGDLIMLEANGRQVLAIIGKDTRAFPELPGHTGIITPPQMAAARAALQAAIVEEEAQRAEAVAAAAAGKDSPAPHADGVTLRVRALPFIEMLKRCEEAGTDIVWGI